MGNENKKQYSEECSVTETAEKVLGGEGTCEESRESVNPDCLGEQTETEPPAPEYEPKNKYERLLYSVYRDSTLAEILRISSYAIVTLTVYAFFARLVGLIGTPIEIVKILAVTGIPFVIVSLMRSLINAPRPYELLEFYEKKPKGKAGKSFPSRHVFSVFVIAAVLITWNPVIAVGLAVLGVLLAFLRVALGIHFVRDVVAGAAIGITSGAIGLLVLHFV